MRVQGHVGDALRGMPIRRKLRVMFMLTIAMAFLVGGIGIVAADYILFYDYLREDLSTFARIIGDNSAAALAFDDPIAGNEILASLSVRSHVETACLYYTDGTALARYKRADYIEGEGCPKLDEIALGDSVAMVDDDLVAFQQVFLDGRQVGALVVRYDLGQIVDRVQLFGLIVLIALLLASILALVLSSRLRALIAEPILELAGAADAVSITKDYRIRAKKLSQDEVGALADALNQMLAGIQSRDEELQQSLLSQQTMTQHLAEVNSDLEQSNAELALSNQDLERFAFVASHDLQEPLRTITTYAQMLAAHKDSADKTEEFVNRIVGGTRRMRELLEDLLAYSEIAGGSEQPREAVHMSEVIDDVLQTLAPRIQESGARISFGPLPVLRAHRGRVTSLMLNLVGNAIKYRSDQIPQINVWVEERQDQFLFKVQDNGIGISSEYHQKIFIAFTRLHGKEIAGTGIGLAICQRVVERYGGAIWVESAESKGATFCFTLPIGMGEGN